MTSSGYIKGSELRKSDLAREPKTRGWYKSKSGSNWLVFSLSDGFNGLQWYAHALNGDASPVDWAYVAQAGDIELFLEYPA